MKAQWIVTIDGDPVVGTNAYTRRSAIAIFCSRSAYGWSYWRSAGYDVVRVQLKSAVRKIAENARIKR